TASISAMPWLKCEAISSGFMDCRSTSLKSPLTSLNRSQVTLVESVPETETSSPDTPTSPPAPHALSANTATTAAMAGEIFVSDIELRKSPRRECIVAVDEQQRTR